MISIELSNGEIIENPSNEQLKSILQRFGKDLDFCNFNYSNKYLSITGDPAGFYFYYKDDNEDEYNSANSLNIDLTLEVLNKIKSDDSSWKMDINFEKEQAQPSNNNNQNNNQEFSVNNIINQAVNSVKKDFGKSLKGFLKKGLKDILPK